MPYLIRAMKLPKPLVFNLLALAVVAVATKKFVTSPFAGELMWDLVAALATIVGLLVAAPLLARIGRRIPRAGRRRTAKPPESRP